MSMKRLVVGLLVVAACLSVRCAPAPPPSSGGEAPPVSASSTPLTDSSPPANAPRRLEAVKVGILSPANLATSGIFIAVERGYFRQEGLDVELISFSRGAEMVPALSTNQLQVGTGSAGAGMFNAVSQNIKNLAVANSSTASPGAGANVMMYRRDLYDSGALVHPEQLRGKTIAISGFDAVQEFAIMGQMVPMLGLAAADITLQGITFPDMAAALANGSVDAALTLEPFSSQIEARNLGVRGITLADVGPNQELASILYSEEFTRNRDAANGWMVAYVKGVRDYNDTLFRQRNDEEVLNILERYRVIPSRDAVATMTLIGINPNGYVYQDYLEEMQSYFV